MWQLLQVVNRVDDNDYYETIDDLERQFQDPRSNPKRDARVFRNALGKLIGFARIFAMPKPANENVAFLACEIAPDVRTQGLEQECIEWMEERAAERLEEIAEANDADDLPRALRVDFPDTSFFVPYYQARGFTHVRSSYNMQRALDEPIPDIPLPPNLTLRNYDSALDDAVRQAFNDSFRDHWGHQDATPEIWETGVAQVSDLRRDLSLVVMDGNEIAAFCINFENTTDNERRNLRRGWVGMLGTRRAWRKRGIASALLAESMRRFRAQGFDWVGLGVDTENLTGALKLYQDLGFKAYKTRVILEKKVAGSR
jgi:ribosomal protein S18 acetylase RimI-like enzyme